jgi:hypothetical protein
MKSYQPYLVCVIWLTACDRLNPVDRTPSVNGLGGASGAGGAQGTGATGAGGSAQGLPCEVQAIVVKYCGSCHGATTSGGAPRSLVSYADLTRPDLMNPSISEAQVSLQRIQDKGSPMPPAPMAGPTAAEIATLQGWVSSSYPSGSCPSGGGGATGGGAGGVSHAGGGGAGGGGAAGHGGGSGSGGGSDTGGLPCDIQSLFASRCESCHGVPPSGGAPRSLVTYANLVAADPASPGMTEAQVALQRMESTTSPMPPAPSSAATSSETAALRNWIASGYPTGTCGGGTGGSQGGVGGSGGSGKAGAGGGDPLNAPATCTSNTTWRGSESSSMAPGQACIGCHARSGGEAPTFVIAGTLYPTGHEPDNCNGTSGSSSGAKVVVTGSNGGSVSLTPNSAGNFYSSSSLPGPYKAKVMNASGAERVMSSTTSTGDCNSCHTQNGANGAPGRITLP